MENKITLTGKLLIISISSFLALLLISGFVGLYTLKYSYTRTAHYIEAVNLARESQVFFQNQFHLWNNIILQGEDYPEYQNGYHSFTQYSDKVQDTLFNLKLLCSNFNSIPDEIDELRSQHKKLTLDYLSLISKFADSNFKNKKEIIQLSKGKDEESLEHMDRLVDRIEDASKTEIRHINNRYFKLTLIVLILISISLILMGLYLAKKILSIHKELDKGIRDRTAALTKINQELETEIQEKIKAEVLLMKSREETEEANIRISLSEKKYRLLVDNSNDIIFSLDEKFNFISANKAIKKHLKLNNNSVQSSNFCDMLFQNGTGITVTNQLIKEKLEAFLQDREPLSFIAQFTSPFASEPKEMNVKMEYIISEDINEIHGIMSPLVDDNLLKYFVSERQRFEIGNYLTAVDDVTYTMIKNLKKYMDQTEISFLRIGLREIIINAIEHGNLKINYNEKTEALINDTYRKLIEDRRDLPENINKTVSIEYQIDQESAVFKITDQGEGFDHKKAMAKDPAEENKEGSAHGRGIMMSREIFDEIKYNETGNQVLLTKTFQAQPVKAGLFKHV
jgi:PAS domain-containing protein